MASTTCWWCVARSIRAPMFVATPLPRIFFPLPRPIVDRDPGDEQPVPTFRFTTSYWTVRDVGRRGPPLRPALVDCDPGDEQPVHTFRFTTSYWTVRDVGRRGPPLRPALVDCDPGDEA